MKSSDYENLSDCRPLRPEASPLRWQDFISFAIFAQAIGNYIDKNLASVCHEGDASVITTLRLIYLLVPQCDCGAFPLLRYTPAPPYDDHNGVDLLRYMAVTKTIFI